MSATERDHGALSLTAREATVGQSKPFDRELVFTDATLLVAAARHSGIKLDPASEAQRILLEFPASGVTVDELAEVGSVIVTSWSAARCSNC